MNQSELNREINQICTELFATADLRALRETSEAVRRRYRDKTAKTPELELREDQEAMAYLAWRFPVTAMVIYEVMLRLAEVDPEFAPRTLLDLGAGPAVSVIPVTQVFPGIRSCTLLEEQPAMIQAGERILGQMDYLLPPGLERIGRRTDFLKTDLPAVDLVLASYSANELDPAELQQLCKQIRSTGGTAVIIVPGTPEHFRGLLTLRNDLLAMGYSILAPCTFSGQCPMEDEADWCHFFVRVARPAILRQLKNAQLAYEDEKFSYLIVRPGPLPPADAMARIIRHPRISKGYREVTLCHRRGIAMARFSKGRHQEIYRDLKKKGWGDRLSLPLHGEDPPNDIPRIR